jgi:hypothetical protein
MTVPLGEMAFVKDILALGSTTDRKFVFFRGRIITVRAGTTWGRRVLDCFFAM